MCTLWRSLGLVGSIHVDSCAFVLAGDGGPSAGAECRVAEVLLLSVGRNPTV